jgi:hypothetical protein
MASCFNLCGSQTLSVCGRLTGFVLSISPTDLRFQSVRVTDFVCLCVFMFRGILPMAEVIERFPLLIGDGSSPVQFHSVCEVM